MIATTTSRWSNGLRKLAQRWGHVLAEPAPRGESLFATDPHTADEAPAPSYGEPPQQALERELAQLRVADQAKARFLAHLGHEIRTPMNGITGMAQLLARTSLDATQRSYVEMMQRSARQLMGLVDRLLDFSRLESGPVELHPEPLDLRGLLDDEVGAGWHRALERGLLLECQLDPALPRWVSADRQRLRQLVAELLDNALEFTQVGQVVLHARPQGAGVSIEVSDTGIGIAQELQASVFMPFVQGDDSLARRQGGIGLGLAVAELLARAMGGRIALHSEPGRGASFALWLPLAALDPESPAPRSAVRRVAVVSDAPASRHALVDRLRFHGHEVVRQLSWRQLAFAPETLVEAKPDHVIYDEPPAGWPPGTPALAGGTSWTSLLLHRRAGPSAVTPGVMRLTRPLSDEQLSAALAPDAEAAGARIDAASTLRGRVLLVEDHEISQVVARSFLEHLGFDVDVAGDAAAALGALQRDDYALVLMDCQMPGMDGYELTRRIRAGEVGPRAQRTPIIALTAHATPGDRQRCLSSGMNDYLAKPVGQQQLSNTLERWLAPPRA